MKEFFVGWELWQEMTFVLACCIVAVFFMGTARLWWTNRVMRRLEVIDEEKRARRSEMHHCGINTWQADEIPFGVRALRPGLEVEGIWISRSHIPQLSQVASSATLLADHMGGSQGKEGSSRSAGRQSEPRYASESTTIDQALHAEPQLSQIPLASDSLQRLGSSPVDSRLPQVSSPPGADAMRSYIPTGWHDTKVVRQATSSAPDRSESNPVSGNDAAIPSNAAPMPHTIQPHGIAEVHANRATRRPNENFEVLPAGTLGPRHELAYTSSDDPVEDVQLPRFQPGPAKLRKKKARRRENDI